MNKRLFHSIFYYTPRNAEIKSQRNHRREESRQCSRVRRNYCYLACYLCAEKHQAAATSGAGFSEQRRRSRRLILTRKEEMKKAIFRTLFKQPNILFLERRQDWRAF